MLPKSFLCILFCFFWTVFAAHDYFPCWSTSTKHKSQPQPNTRFSDITFVGSCEAGSGGGAETASAASWPPSDGETGRQSNRQGQHRRYLWADCFGFMWTPSKAAILSQPTLRSLSPYNLWQSSSLSVLPVLLFGWTAESRGELVLPLQMTPVPLHFLPHHCVLHGLCRGGIAV